MQIFKGIKRVVKPLVDVPTWMGYRTLADNGKNVLQSVKDIFTPIQGERTESFEQAISRLELTEETIKKQEKAFLILELFWLVIALLMLVYTLWLFATKGFVGGVFSLSMAFLASVLWFRYDFWRFQVKNRLLGADFKTWLNSWLRIQK